jgi:putative flavoprotein involved in K+ transport
MNHAINTLIIGGGQAGLSLSYYLTQQGRPHLILEQAAQIGAAWRNQRWDSFTLVTPNWQLRLPGAEYNGDEPDGFLSRAALVAYLDEYAASLDAPVQCGVRALNVDRLDHGFRIQTGAGLYEAANVVVATGLFQQPKIPSWGQNLPDPITQLHSSHYRNPSALPAGAVLVVGSAQSGCQIVEDLYGSGRKVYLCVGASSGRGPRRYRGHDCTRWLDQMGFFNRTVDQLPSPQAKFRGSIHLSGAAGGHTLNLHQFARDGVTLLGRLINVQNSKVKLAPDLHENLAKADQFEAELVRQIDEYILRNHLIVPTETLPQLHDGFNTPLITELDLNAAGITTVIWALGYTFDFSWVRLPLFDADGFPVQQRGVTSVPGLYFLGLPWLHTAKSGLLYGVGEDAAYLAAHIAAHR